MKLIALLSGGIDSPVAVYEMCKAGADVVLLHMDNTPYSDEAQRKDAIELADALRKATGKELPLWIAPHKPSQDAIHDNCEAGYQCVMCKRVMQRTAREMAKRLGCSGIIMGDSLGQVASQTLRNIRSENIGLDFPVVRPLIGFDKIEIEEIARKIGTYEISIRPGHGCSIVPLRPVTEAKPEKVLEMSERADADGLAVASADAAYLVQ